MKLYFEQYENYKELIDTIVSRQEVKSPAYALKIKNVRACETNGNMNWDEAVRALTCGWEKGLDTWKSNTSVSVKHLQDKQQRQLRKSIKGFMVNVPNAIRNVPKSMFDYEISVKKVKVLDILIDATYSWGASEKEVVDYYSRVIRKIEQLELDGYRCRVSIIQVYGYANSSRVCPTLKLVIKKESDLWDIKKLVFPLTHLGMFRTIGFCWVGNLPGFDYSNIDSGLGRPLSSWKRENRSRYDELMGLVKEKTNEKQVFISYGSDLNEAFK